MLFPNNHRGVRVAGVALLALFLRGTICAEELTTGIQLILPGVVLAGEPATLAVLSEGRPAAGVQVELDGGERVATDARGRAHFRGPSDRLVVTVRVGDATATATVLAAGTLAATERPQVERVTRLLALGDSASIRGRHFDGNAEANRVFLGAAEAIVLAASPVVLVIAPTSQAPLGMAELRVETRGQTSNSRPVTLVALRIEAPANLVAGQKVRPRVVVEGTQERMQLEVTNRSPAVLRLEGGNERRVTTSGGEPNAVELKARALAVGSFLMSARIVATATGGPDAEYARQLLDRARQLTDNSQIRERIAWMLVQLDRKPLRPSAITQEINRVLGSYALTVPLGKTLEAARDALEGH